MIHSSALTTTVHNTIGEATVRMPGTCGELVQGMIEGTAFHISCPIDIFSTVTVQVTDAIEEWVFSPQFPKAAAAVKAALDYLDAKGLGGQLSIDSPLPRGKGMASSTADVAGAIHALALALGRHVEYAEVARLALMIEPSDGSIFPDIALFDHRQGSVCETLGPPPPIDIVVLDCGGEVDTIAFNGQDRAETLARLQPRAVEALEAARRGLRTGDLALIGRAATLSAMANQEVIYKPQLDTVLRLADEIGALGVNVGHSGTVIGVLLDRSRDDAKEVAAFFSERLPEVECLSVCHLIGGGYQEA